MYLPTFHFLDMLVVIDGKNIIIFNEIGQLMDSRNYEPLLADYKGDLFSTLASNKGIIVDYTFQRTIIDGIYPVKVVSTRANRYFELTNIFKTAIYRKNKSTSKTSLSNSNSPIPVATSYDFVIKEGDDIVAGELYEGLLTISRFRRINNYSKEKNYAHMSTVHYPQYTNYRLQNPVRLVAGGFYLRGKQEAAKLKIQSFHMAEDTFDLKLLKQEISGGRIVYSDFDYHYAINNRKLYRCPLDLLHSNRNLESYKHDLSVILAHSDKNGQVFIIEDREACWVVNSLKDVVEGTYNTKENIIEESIGKRVMFIYAFIDSYLLFYRKKTEAIVGDNIGSITGVSFSVLESNTLHYQGSYGNLELERIIIVNESIRYLVWKLDICDEERLVERVVNGQCDYERDSVGISGAIIDIKATEWLFNIKMCFKRKIIPSSYDNSPHYSSDISIPYYDSDDLEVIAAEIYNVAPLMLIINFLNQSENYCRAGFVKDTMDVLVKDITNYVYPSTFAQSSLNRPIQEVLDNYTQMTIKNGVGSVYNKATTTMEHYICPELADKNWYMRDAEIYTDI